MSALTPGTPAANAKQVRALAQALTSLHKPSTVPSFTAIFTYCESSHALATLSADDASVFFPALQSALSILHPYARTASLQATILSAQQTPPSILATYWTSLAQRATSLLKSVADANPALTAQALAALSTLIAAGAPLALKGGEHKASVSTVCHSAIFHATRALNSKNPPATVALSAIALLFSVLHAAPRELRQGLSRHEAALRNKWFDHPAPLVRKAAVRLFAHLFACCPDKVKQKVFDERIQHACQQLDQILDVLDLFTPGDDIRRMHSETEVRSFYAIQLSRRYSALSELLRDLLEQVCSVPLALPLPTLLHTLCRGIAERQIDPYATGFEGVALDAGSALPVLSTVSGESLSTLVVLIDTTHRGAALPYTQVVARAFQRRLSQVILRVRAKDGAVACILERRALYQAVARLVDVLGSGFMEQIAPLFSELFEGDVELYACTKRAEEILMSQSASNMPESTRSRKRRRNSHANNRDRAQKEASAWADTGHSLAKTVGSKTVQEMEVVLTAGIEVTVAMFENRGLLPSRAMEALTRLEVALAHLTGCCGNAHHILDAVRAVALGGGSSRLQGEASPLLLQCSMLSRDAVLLASSSFEERRIGFRARSSCESVFHPRGPPVVKYFSRKHEESHNGSKAATRRPASPKAKDGEVEHMDIDTEGNRTKKRSRALNVESKFLGAENKKFSGEAGSQQQRRSDPELALKVKEGIASGKQGTEVKAIMHVRSAQEENRRPLKKIVEDRGGSTRMSVQQPELAQYPLTNAVAVEDDGKGLPETERICPSIASHQLTENAVNSSQNGNLPATDAKDRDAPVSETKDAPESNKREEGDGEEIASDEDEEALIASLRFEQSDEE